jgi:hypothetical protein
MVENDVRLLDPVPTIWTVILFRMKQAEERERVLGDWEANVFGPLRHDERGLGISAIAETLGIGREVISERIIEGSMARAIS